MKILAVSDKVVDWIYSPRIRLQLSDIELVLGCGDLPPYYLEFILSTLDIPVLFVHGNHSVPEDWFFSDPFPRGSIDIHRKVKEYHRYIFAGVEGSLQYNEGIYQYSQIGMWLNVFSLVPKFLLNRLRFGRALDVLVTHAPPWGIHDQADLPHQGIRAFRWLLQTFQPSFHVHGHIHVYRPDTTIVSTLGKTKVINAYGYYRLDL